MKRKITCLLMVVLSGYIANAQNVGIGTASPEVKLHIASADTNALRIENTTALDTGVSNGIYFKTGNWFTGGIRHTGTGASFSRTGILGYASANTSSLKEYISVADNGNVGIGNINPAARLDVAGPVKIADGTQGNAKVLTSDAGGNASWKESAFNNTERFCFNNNYTTAAGEKLTTYYNTGTTTANNSLSGSPDLFETRIVITNPGLYHFDIHCDALLMCNSVFGGIYLDLYDYTTSYRYYINDLFEPFIANTNTGYITSSYDKTMDIFIDIPRSLYFKVHSVVGGLAHTTDNLNLNVTGYKIAN